MRYTSPESQPYTVALEGGPCGGKTTAAEYIARRALQLGTRLVILPEVATDFINEKQVDVPWLAQNKRAEFIDLETELLDLIVGGIKQAQQREIGKNSIILADRCDVAAYVEPHEYEEITRRLGFDRAPHLTLVNKIAYMPSLAHHDPAMYEKLMSTNGARYEDAAGARATCDSNRRTLDMHPGFEVFSDHDFDARLARVASSILSREVAVV